MTSKEKAAETRAKNKAKKEALEKENVQSSMTIISTKINNEFYVSLHNTDDVKSKLKEFAGYEKLTQVKTLSTFKSDNVEGDIKSFQIVHDAYHLRGGWYSEKWVIQTKFFERFEKI